MAMVLFVHPDTRARMRGALLAALCLLVLFAATAAPPADASHGAAPSPDPLGPDADRFHLHVADGILCGLDAAAMAGTSLHNPMVYATNTVTDPCGESTDTGQTGRSVHNPWIVHEVHVILDPTQSVELETGSEITATVWLWADQAGTLNPSFRLIGGNHSASLDRTVAASAELVPSVTMNLDGRVWERFDVSFGAAPAELGRGVATLEVRLDNRDGSLSHLGVTKTGLGFTGLEQGYLDLPLAVQVDDPVDEEEPPAPPVTWPPALQESTVRPGVKHVTNGAQCTTNFVFRDRTTERLYMGTAAHCVDDIGYGGTSQIATWQSGSGIRAKLVFSTYREHGYGNSDFALLEIPEADEHKVHPAVVGFGGPTGLAAPTDVNTFDKVITFGNSGLRPGPRELDAREGYVLGDSTRYTSVYLVTPAIPGDSGSGLMTAEGLAIGAASTIEILPVTGRNHYSNIWVVLNEMKRDGWDLELVTWDLMEDGHLPALP